MLAEDETDLLLFPPLRAGWSKQGEATRVWLSGRNARRVLFGAMNLRTGTRLLVPRKKGKSVDFQALAEEVRWHDRGWQGAMVLDEAPCHTAQASPEAVAGMTLRWLPKRSPKLNPMDPLWGQAKEVVSANKHYPTIEEHVERCLNHLQRRSHLEALHTAGILSDKFWLRGALSNLGCGPA